MPPPMTRLRRRSGPSISGRLVIPLDDDDCAAKLGAAIANVCHGYPHELVVTELIAALGEAIGHSAHRDQALRCAIAHLTQYVSEIPPC
jgi:hypothetical protein